MKKIKLKSIILAVGLLACSVGGAFRAFAEDSQSSTMILSPMSQKMVLIPGESVRASVDVSNPNDATSSLDYSVYIGSFKQKQDQDSVDDYGTVDTEEVSGYNAMMNWIVLDRDSGSVAPNHTDTIWFTINVPEDAPAGGQYATILVKDNTKKEDSNGGNVMIQSVVQVASIIYAEVAGETRDEGEILKNEVPGIVLSNPLSVSSMVKNNGNVHTDAEYILQAWPVFSDEEICTNEEDSTKGLVMPETSKYHVEECNLPSVGLFKVKQTVRIFNEESTVEKIVIMCPIWLIFVVIFVIFAAVFYFASRLRKRKKSEKK